MKRGTKKHKMLYAVLAVVTLSSFLIAFFVSRYNVQKKGNLVEAASESTTLTSEEDWLQGDLINADTSSDSIKISDSSISWSLNQLGNLGSFTYGVSAIDLGDGRGDGTNRLYFAPIDPYIGEVWYSGGSWSYQLTNILIGGYRWYVDAKTPGKVYSGGMSGAMRHEYISGNWQNTNLSATWPPDYSGDLFVNGDDVYFVSGKDLSLEGREYKLWKNDTAIWSLTAPDESDNRIMITGGDGRNDGVIRMYVYTQEGDIYEFSPNGSSWTANNIYNGSSTTGTLQIYLGDGRNDGINRLYFYNSNSTQISEYTYSDGNWSNTATITASQTINKMTFGDGRNDGSSRIYYSSGNSLYEISYYPYIDGNWVERTVGTDSGATLGEIVIGNGRNDGVNRIYATNSSENTIDEFTYTGGKPTVHISAATQIDGGENFSEWTSFLSTQTVPDNTSLSFRFRTSIDSINWTEWSDPQNYSENTVDISSLVTSQQNGNYYRYLQIESTLISTDTISTPTLSEYVVYFKTEEPPSVPTCEDGVQNGDETGVDCGGSCNPCEIPPEESCSDGIQNQDETGIDCGGSCPACPLVCPLPDTDWCNTVECDNKIEILSPITGSRYATGSIIDISWQNKSSAKSLIEGWNIRYNVDISYDGGEKFSRIASAIKDVNFPDQSAWQEIFADPNWQNRLKNNHYKFNLPRVESVISDQVKIRVNMYRTEANPFGCSPYGEDISKNFSIYRDKIDPICEDNQYYFSLPENTVRANTANTQYYYLSQSEINNWPKISFDIRLNKIGQKNPIANSNLQVSPISMAQFNSNGKLVVNADLSSPQNFSLIYYDQECDREYTLNIVADRNSNQEKIKVLTPNGGEYWLLSKQYAIEWENSFKQDVVSYVAIDLSLDGGKSWNWKVTKENSDSGNRKMIKVDSLSLENSYLWSIPKITELISNRARVRISAYDKNGIFLASDTSDENFEISDSEVGAVIDIIKNLLDEVAKALAVMALLATSTILVIPYIQNVIAFSSFYEQMYGILSSGKKRKNDWGLVYDADNGLAIPNALITLHDADTKRLIETTISNKEGRYGFIARKGKYFIKVKKQNYEIASSNIVVRQGLKYQNNYFGETIIISEEEQVILANIPMRSLDSLNNNAKKVNILSTVEKYLIIFNWPLISLGTIVSVLALYYSPNIVNLIILIIYIPLWIFQIDHRKKIKAFGLVLDSADMKPVDLALIRVFNQSNNMLVRTVASDLKGHYAVLVSKGRYDIHCNKPGFTSSPITDKVINMSYKPLSDTIYLNKIEI